MLSEAEGCQLLQLNSLCCSRLTFHPRVHGMIWIIVPPTLTMISPVEGHLIVLIHKHGVSHCASRPAIARRLRATVEAVPLLLYYPRRHAWLPGYLLKSRLARGDEKPDTRVT